MILMIVIILLHFYFKRVLTNDLKTSMYFIKLTHSVRSDSPQFIFSGPHRQSASLCSLRRTRSSPAALCMLF